MTNGHLDFVVRPVPDPDPQFQPGGGVVEFVGTESLLDRPKRRALTLKDLVPELEKEKEEKRSGGAVRAVSQSPPSFPGPIRLPGYGEQSRPKEKEDVDPPPPPPPPPEKPTHQIEVITGTDRRTVEVPKPTI